MGFKKLGGSDAKKAIDILKASYKDAHYYLNFNTPIDLMIAAIISAQTRDEVVNSITPGLFKRFRTLDDYAKASPKEVERYIGGVSFPVPKAANIVKACRIAKEKWGKVPNSMDDLISLPGIGRKTANTILINAYGIIDGIPVDTWVIKLSYRIGLSENTDPEKIERDLMAIVEKKDWKKIAYVLKAHGKAICQSQAPLCSKCMINKMCPRNGVTNSK